MESGEKEVKKKRRKKNKRVWGKEKGVRVENKKENEKLCGAF